MLKNDGRRIVESRLKNVLPGETLLDYLTHRFPYHSRSAWQEKIAAGELSVNGIPAAAGTIPVEGALLRYDPGELAEPPADLAFTIVAEDDDMVLVSKSGNLPCHPAGPYFRHTLWYLLQERFGSLYPVNRIDRETSGLTLWGKSSQAAARLASAVRAKEYRVLVSGEFPAAMDTAGFLYRDPANLVRKRRFFRTTPPENLPSESASTTFRLLRFDGRFSLLAAFLHTGRTHQIRATLRSLGYPVAGDKLYGPNQAFYLKQKDDSLSPAERAALVFPRQALHCHRLAIQSRSGSVSDFFAPAPADIPCLGESAFSGNGATPERRFADF